MKIALAASLVLTFCSLAAADPITYTIAGTGSGTVGPAFSPDVTTFTNTGFSFSLTSDTTAITTISGIPDTLFSGFDSAATVSINGLFSGMTGGPVALDGSGDTVDFYLLNPINVMFRLTSSALDSYGFTTTIGPVPVTAQLNPNLRLPGQIIGTSFGEIVFSDVSNVTFAANVGTPEPQSLALLGIGLLGLGGLLRRSKKQ